MPDGTAFEISEADSTTGAGVNSFELSDGSPIKSASVSNDTTPFAESQDENSDNIRHSYESDVDEAIDAHRDELEVSPRNRRAAAKDERESAEPEAPEGYRGMSDEDKRRAEAERDVPGSFVREGDYTFPAISSRRRRIIFFSSRDMYDWLIPSASATSFCVFSRRPRSP